MRTTVDVNIHGRQVFYRDAGGTAPLYVSRKLLNPQPLATWAQATGLKNLTPSDEMHVTIVYSMAPVDWFAMEGYAQSKIFVPEGGPRRLEVFKDDVVVLRFKSMVLSQRNAELRRMGCSSDWLNYAPHVTLAGGAGSVDIDRVKAYSGELEFGPEIFAPIKDK